MYFILRVRNELYRNRKLLLIIEKVFAPGEARTQGLQIMRLTRCLLRYGSCTGKHIMFKIYFTKSAQKMEESLRELQKRKKELVLCRISLWYSNTSESLEKLLKLLYDESGLSTSSCAALKF
jgi:hypothetical protein